MVDQPPTPLVVINLFKSVEDTSQGSAGSSVVVTIGDSQLDRLNQSDELGFSYIKSILRMPEAKQAKFLKGQFYREG